MDNLTKGGVPRGFDCGVSGSAEPMSMYLGLSAHAEAVQSGRPRVESIQITSQITNRSTAVSPKYVL